MGDHTHKPQLDESPYDVVIKAMQAVMGGTGPQGAAPGTHQLPSEFEGALDTGRAFAGTDDKAAMLDRMAAQKELRDRFDIISEADAKDKKKQHAPNAITEAKLKELAKTYSDIRLGKSDLKIMDGMNGDFRKAAMEDIARVLQTESGRDLIAQLANNVPDKKSGVHRTTELTSHKKGEGSSAPGKHNQDDPRNGKGDDMIVKWRPGETKTSGVKDEDWYPMRSDVTLFHELTHALHGTHGKMKAGHREEEYRTVGLDHHDHGITENAYRRERARIGASNKGEVELDDDMKRRRGYSEYREKPHKH